MENDKVSQYKRIKTGEKKKKEIVSKSKNKSRTLEGKTEDLNNLNVNTESVIPSSVNDPKKKFKSPNKDDKPEIFRIFERMRLKRQEKLNQKCLMET